MSESNANVQHSFGLPDACQIRLAQDDDLTAITDIYNQAVATGGSSADTTVQNIQQRSVWLHSHAPREQYPVIVVEEAGEKIAFASISRFHPRPGYDADVELSYYVDVSHRGRGLGSALVRWGLHTARELRYDKLITVIFADNRASMSLMKRFNFTQYGLLPQAAADSHGVHHDVAYWYQPLN